MLQIKKNAHFFVRQTGLRLSYAVLFILVFTFIFHKKVEAATYFNYQATSTYADYGNGFDFLFGAATQNTSGTDRQFYITLTQGTTTGGCATWNSYATLYEYSSSSYTGLVSSTSMEAGTWDDTGLETVLNYGYPTYNSSGYRGAFVLRTAYPMSIHAEHYYKFTLQCGVYSEHQIGIYSSSTPFGRISDTLAESLNGISTFFRPTDAISFAPPSQIHFDVPTSTNPQLHPFDNWRVKIDTIEPLANYTVFVQWKSRHHTSFGNGGSGFDQAHISGALLQQQNGVALIPKSGNTPEEFTNNQFCYGLFTAGCGIDATVYLSEDAENGFFGPLPALGSASAYFFYSSDMAIITPDTIISTVGVSSTATSTYGLTKPNASSSPLCFNETGAAFIWCNIKTDLIYPHAQVQDALSGAISDFKTHFPFGIPFQVYDIITLNIRNAASSTTGELALPIPTYLQPLINRTSSVVIVSANLQGHVFDSVPGSQRDLFNFEDGLMAFLTLMGIVIQIRHPWMPFNEQTELTEKGYVYRDPVTHDLITGHNITKVRRMGRNRWDSV